MLHIDGETDDIVTGSQAARWRERSDRFQIFNEIK